MPISQNKARNGSFTSSEIVCLTKEGKAKGTWGEPALTYILETNMERRLGRSLDGEVDSRPCIWGNFVEPLLFGLLGDEYSYNSQDTLIHPDYDCWAGSPDGFAFNGKKIVVDTKAPYTLKSFCQLVQPLYDGLTGMDAMNALRFGYTDKKGFPVPKHKDGEKFFWQLLSNSIIEPCDIAQLIVYCPYESELEAIQHAAVKSGNPDYYFIASSPKEKLPYLIEDGYYKNINIIEFEIPKEDKQKLETLVQRASELLIKI